MCLDHIFPYRKKKTIFTLALCSTPAGSIRRSYLVVPRALIIKYIFYRCHGCAAGWKIVDDGIPSTTLGVSCSTRPSDERVLHAVIKIKKHPSERYTSTYVGKKKIIIRRWRVVVQCRWENSFASLSGHRGDLHKWLVDFFTSSYHMIKVHFSPSSVALVQYVLVCVYVCVHVSNPVGVRIIIFIYDVRDPSNG